MTIVKWPLRWPFHFRYSLIDYLTLRWVHYGWLCRRDFDDCFFKSVINRSKTICHFSILFGTPTLLQINCCMILKNWVWESSLTFPLGSAEFLSVQCNTLHGTEYKITCGVCLCVFLCVRAHRFWGQISRKRLEIEVQLHWNTNRKWQ